MADDFETWWANLGTDGEDPWATAEDRDRAKDLAAWAYSAGVQAAMEEQVGIRRLHVEGGKIEGDFTAPPFVIRAMGDALLGMLDGAPNYTEAQIIAGASDGQQYVMRIERYFGRTPHQLRRDAETERDRLAAELAALKAGKA